MTEVSIKALCLYQFWASLMALGAKRFETRSWGTKYRGLVVICASKTLEFDPHDARMLKALRESGIDNPYKLPLGMALAVGELVGCYNPEPCIRISTRPSACSAITPTGDWRGNSRT